MRQHENSIFLKNFSAALRKARGGRSQAAMARFLGIPNQQTYQRYEGGINEPLVTPAHEICGKIGVSLEQLLSGQASNGRPLSSDSNGVTRVHEAVAFLADQLGIPEAEVLSAVMEAVTRIRNGGKKPKPEQEGKA